MKRTTYIMIGMLLAGFVVISGMMFYSISHGTTREDTYMEIGGEQKTVQLPECRVVQFVWTETENEKYLAINQFKFPLKVQSADVGSLSYANEMDKYMNLQSVGDTLRITFNFSNEKLEKKFQNKEWLNIRFAEMRLNLPVNVQQVLVGVKSMETTFSNFRCDTLSFQSSGVVRVENCQITVLTAQARTLNFDSGEVRDLYLNLDDINNWTVNTDSFHIDTEYLTGSMNHNCVLQKGECRQVLWTPKSDNASLDVKLEQAVKIELSE